MRSVLLLVLTFVTLLAGCSSQADDMAAAPGTPKVTKTQALELAQSYYRLIQTEVITIRHLERWEMDERPSETYPAWPIYYVIRGKDADQNSITVYISAQDPAQHFSVIDNSFSIGYNLIASEKTWPQDQTLVYKRKMVPYLEYVALEAETKAEFDLAREVFQFAPADRTPDFAASHVFFISVRESS